MNTIEVYCQPQLNWPAGYDRTAPADRYAAKFSRIQPIQTPGGIRGGKASMSIDGAGAHAHIGPCPRTPTRKAPPKH